MEGENLFWAVTDECLATTLTSLAAGSSCRLICSMWWLIVWPCTSGHAWQRWQCCTTESRSGDSGRSCLLKSSRSFRRYRVRNSNWIIRHFASDVRFFFFFLLGDMQSFFHFTVSRRGGQSRRSDFVFGIASNIPLHPFGSGLIILSRFSTAHGRLSIRSLGNATPFSPLFLWIPFRSIQIR